MKPYVWTLGAVILLVTLTAWLSSFALWRMGELWPAQWIASYQIQHQALWSEGMRSSEISYKEALYDQVKPQVIVLGSSRALQFRETLFGKTFLNMGRGVDHFALPDSYRHLTRRHTPELVIWGVDYWQFARSKCQQISSYHSRQDRVAGTGVEGDSGLEIAPRNLFSLWTRVLSGEISPGPLFRASILGHAYPGVRIGLRANVSNIGGYIQDGSYVYLSEYARPQTTYDSLLQKQNNFLQTESVYNIIRDEGICEPAVEAFDQTLEYMQTSGTRVILLTPPMPAAYARHFAANRYFSAYYQTTQSLVARQAGQRGFSLINALDVNAYSFADKEFIDPSHPGETISARLLLEALKRGYLDQSILNEPGLRSVVETCAGMATCGPEYGRFGIERLEPVP